LAVGVGSVMAAAETRPAETAAYPIVVVDGPVHDFGEIRAAIVNHTFLLRNIGKADLHVEEVKPTCSCTAAGDMPKVIKAGERAELPFRLSTTRYNGSFSTTINIRTDDPAHPQTVLTLRGTARRPMLVDTQFLNFGRVKANDVATRTVTVTSNIDEPIKPTIRDQDSVGPFKGELKEIEPGKKYELEVTASPPYQVGYNRFVMTLDSGLPDSIPAQIVCMAMLPRRLEVIPAVLNIPAGGTVTSREIRLVNNGEQPVKVTSVEATDPRLTVESSPISEGHQYRVRVDLPEDYVPPAGAQIVLKLDDQEEPSITVPLRRVEPPAAAPAQRSTARTPTKPAFQLLGKEAPSVSAETYDDKTLKIGPDSGKVQLITFYASWCPYCRRAMPEVQKIYQQYKDKGVDVVAINLDRRSGRGARTEQQSLETYKQLKLDLPMVMDPEQEIGRKFNMVGTGIPAFFLVGADGTIEHVTTGANAVAGNAMTSKIDVLLKGKTREDFP
jgi:thiol-disulfide isomerase/thioredoxin